MLHLQLSYTSWLNNKEPWRLKESLFLDVKISFNVLWQHIVLLYLYLRMYLLFKQFENNLQRSVEIYLVLHNIYSIREKSIYFRHKNYNFCQMYIHDWNTIKDISVKTLKKCQYNCRGHFKNYSDALLFQYRRLFVLL